jgi:hypothetical protein
MTLLARFGAPALGVAALLGGCHSTPLEAFVDVPQAASGAPEPGAGADKGCDICVFPAAAILDSDNGSVVPGDVSELFGPPEGLASGVGPCLVEPELGSVFPRNWLRPRFRFIAAAGQKLFELRLRAASEPNELIVYTSAGVWTFPHSLWEAVTQRLVDQAIYGIDSRSRSRRCRRPAVTSVYRNDHGLAVGGERCNRVLVHRLRPEHSHVGAQGIPNR